MLPTWEFPKIKGASVGDPNNKDYSILGSLPYKCAFLEHYPHICGTCVEEARCRAVKHAWTKSAGTPVPVSTTEVPWGNIDP